MTYTQSTKQIPLTQGKFATVDAADYDWLNQFNWHVTMKGYAARTTRPNGKTVTVLMHRVIMSTPEPLFTDHIDGDKLNNTRANLRFCTNSQNHMNRKPLAVGSSKFKGVCWHKKTKLWYAYIYINCAQKHLGCFSSESAAAEAYNAAALLYYGEFARVNSI